MSRSINDDSILQYAKYEIFKKAYDAVNFFTESGNLIGAFVLSFSILEDRLCAAVVVCSNALNRKIEVERVSRIKFTQLVKYLLEMDAIDKDLHDRLVTAAHLRNDLTHKMMWRLDVFQINHIKSFRGLINELQKVQRKHEKLLNKLG